MESCAQPRRKVVVRRIARITAIQCALVLAVVLIPFNYLIDRTIWREGGAMHVCFGLVEHSFSEQTCSAKRPQPLP